MQHKKYHRDKKIKGRHIPSSLFVVLRGIWIQYIVILDLLISIQEGIGICIVQQI